MKTTSTRPRREPEALTTLDPTDIETLPWRPVTGCPGVRAAELWRSGHSVDALIAYEPMASTPGQPHPAANHHIWVVSGAARLAGRHLTAGSYAYVAPGVAHPIGDVGPEGCVILQIHRPLPVGPDDTP
jgi:hypothetical protein